MVASGPSSSFVGRDRELELLTAVLAEAGGAADGDDDAEAIVRISGEAGVGKSRLVAEAIARSGVRCLVGVSSPASLGRSFDLLLSAVEPHVRNWTAVPDDLAGISRALSQLLRAVAPKVRSDDADAAAPSELISAGLALIRHIDVDAVVIEDLQWGDIESIQIIERLLAGRGHPKLIVTYRSEDLDSRSPAADLLSALGARRGSQHLHLQPFDTDEIRELVTARVGASPADHVVTRLHARTGGNAFYLEELLASTDNWDLPRETLDDLPETLTETLRLRLSALSAPERDTLATAAVLGSPFEFDLLATALGVEESELIERLRVLIERRLIVEPDVDVFRFRHELVRESVLTSLLGRERRRLHLRALNATRSHRPDDFAELARHAAGAGQFDELARVAPTGVRHYLARGATRSALLLAESALEEWPDNPELRELAARAAWLTGQNERAQEHATRWRSAATRTGASSALPGPDGAPSADGTASGSGREASDDPHGIEALALLARIAYEADQHETERDIVAEMERLLDVVTEPTQSARLLAWLAQQHMLMDNNERALELADEALALATEHELDGLARQITVEQASTWMRDPAHRDDAAALLDRTAEEAAAAGDFVVAARALHNLSLCQPPEQADATLDRMAQFAETGGFDLATSVLLPIRKISVAVQLADLRSVQEWIGRASPISAKVKVGGEMALHKALVVLESGAELTDHELAQLPEGKPFSWSMHLMQAARTRDVERAVALLDNPPPHDGALPGLALAAGELLNVGVPVTALARARDTARQHAKDPADFGEAILAERLGDPDATERIDALLGAPAASSTGAAAADGSLSDARTIAAEVERLRKQRTDSKPPADGPPIMSNLEYAELFLARARLLARAGQRESSRRAAQTAAMLLERWPGVRRDEALALAAEPECSDELTGREIDVARLVARGMTNGQIADELFIARKTVSTHVSNILAKLQMSSRTEIATWTIRTGLLPDLGATR